MVRIEDLIYQCLEAGPAHAQRLEELGRAHPEHAERLARMLGDLRTLGFLGAARPLGEAAVALPKAVGGYRLEEVIGRGGMGFVVRAAQVNLGDRPVAVKMIRPELVADPRAEARFLREAMLAAKLDHPCLCPVLDFGRSDGLPYLVMPLIEGELLSRCIAAARAAGGSAAGLTLPTSGSERAQWVAVVAMVEKLARGLHAAHGQGLVHRDVKPGNVMVRPDGDPVLLDFGLARTQERAANDVTLSHEVLGTPAYMAPEQIEPGQAPIDARTDVYALGVLLYECLTLQLPHAAATHEQLVRRIVSEPPSDLRRHRPGLPRDLAVVLAVALEKAPSRRYVSALAFAEDLARVRAGQPILARRPGPMARAARWVGRNPWPTTAGVVLAIGLLMSVWLLATVREQARRTRALALVGSSQEAAVVDTTLSLHLALAATDVAPDLPETRDQLHRAARNQHERSVQDGFAGSVLALEYGADGSLFAVGANGRLVHRGPSGDLVEQRHLGFEIERAFPVVRAGRTEVVLGCADGRLRLWQPGQPGDLPRLGPAHEPAPGAILFGAVAGVARDGTSILVGTKHGRAVHLSLPDGRLLRELRLHANGRDIPIACCAFAGTDGFVLAGAGSWVQHWGPGQEPVHTFRHDSQDRDGVTALAVDAAGTTVVAMVPGYQRLLSCSLETGESRLLEERRLGWRHLVGDPEGQGFAAGGNDGGIALWRFGDFGPRRLLVGHQGNITALRFSRDGGTLVSGGVDRVVRRWTRDGALLFTGHGHRAMITALAPDGPDGTIASAGDDASLRTWNERGGLPDVEHPRRAPESFGRFVFDGRGNAWLGDGMTGHVARLAPGRDEPAWVDFGDPDPTCLQLGVDHERQLLLIGRQKAVELRSSGDGRLLAREKFENGVVGSDLAPDAKTVVVVLQGGMRSKPRLQLFAVQDGSLQRTFDTELEVWNRPRAYLNRADLAPDGRTIVVCRLDGTVRLFDLAGKPRSEALRHCPDDGLAPYRGTLSRDGSILLTAGTDGVVKIWRRGSDGGWSDRVLMRFDGRVRSAYFDHEERRVVAGADDGVLRVVDLDGNVLHQFQRRESAFHCVRFSPDGREVAATTLDGHFLRWMLDLETLRQAARPLLIRDLTAAERAMYANLLGGGR